MEEDDPKDYMEDSPPRITSTRRRELMAFAAHLAEVVEAKIKKHERCLLRRMVENLMEND